MSAKPTRVLLRAADAGLAGAAALAAGVRLLARRRRPPDRAPAVPERPRLMAIDSMYSLSMLRARQALHLVTHRDLDGYFGHVWTVHPFVGVDSTRPDAPPAGPATVTALDATHTMVEGRAGRLPALTRLPYLNFVLAQTGLVLALDRIVARERVAILRGDPYYHGLFALLLGRLNRCRVEIRVIANHDAIYGDVGSLAYPRLFRFRALERAIARFTLSRADSVVIASDDNRAFALRNGTRPERIAFAANGSMVNPLHLEDPAQREPLDRDELGLGERPIVVCVSRLEHLKHPEDVLVSVAVARRREPRIAAVLVGEGAMRRELEALRDELGLHDDVVFAGDRDQRWIARLLTQAAVVAAPLAGLALVESALSGTPIVAYDVEWHAELLRDGHDALLVPYRDTDAMAAAICALVQDAERARVLAGSARARVLQVMDPARLLAAERDLAERLLAGVSAPSA